MILLDTSFLIACAQFRIDYLSEFERIFSFAFAPVIIDKVWAELVRLSKEGVMKKRLAAKLAMAIAKNRDIKMVSTQKGKNADDSIFQLANKDCIVATIDSGLKTLLKKKCVPLVVVRQKKYVVFVD